MEMTGRCIELPRHSTETVSWTPSADRLAAKRSSMIALLSSARPGTLLTTIPLT